MIRTWWRMPKGLLWAPSTIPASFTPICVEYWNHGSESRNHNAFGHEYSKSGFQGSAAMGIFDGKRERIENEKFGGFVAENYRALTMLSPWIF
jgi:hypothetical protein